jgi:citrate lyase subunit beta-like protein
MFVKTLRCARVLCRQFGTDVSAPLRRSYLYVPASSEKMLEKSLTSTSDMIIYDLEDSVPPSPADKNNARIRLKNFLIVCSCHALSSNLTRQQQQNLPHSQRIAVRVNDINTPFFNEDINQIVNMLISGHLVVIGTQYCHSVNLICCWESCATENSLRTRS